MGMPFAEKIKYNTNQLVSKIRAWLLIPFSFGKAEEINKLSSF